MVESGIQIERSQRDVNTTAWWWIRGDTYPHRDLLKRAGCRWSKRRKAWYLIAETLPEAIQALTHTPKIEDDAPCSVEEAVAILGMQVKDTTLPAMEFPPEPEELPKIRITPPPSGTASDTVTTAIQEMKTVTHSTVQQTDTPRGGKRQLAHIPQAYVGEVTGSITGHVYSYGYAVHDGICVYLNLAGPRMAVEAIRAKMSKGDIVTLVPWDAPSVELTAGEGNMGMYTDYFANIPEARFTSLILLHDSVINPNYNGKATTFLFHISDAQALGQLHRHVSQLVKIPVFESWSSYLWNAGQAAMLVRKTRGDGGLTVYTIDLDSDSWTRLITGGLSQGIITLC